VRHSILERIAEYSCPEKCETVIEIGPGRGALTSYLLARAERVIAIEIDPVLVQYLRAEFRDSPRLTLVEADVLKADLTQWGPATVVGNLPYYITSPILEQTLALGPLLQHAVFLVQKEVAERLIARPGSRDYGYLSVQTQIRSAPELLFTVPAISSAAQSGLGSGAIDAPHRSGAGSPGSRGVPPLRGPVLPPQAENNSQQSVAEPRSRAAGCHFRNCQARRAAFHPAIRSIVSATSSNQW